MKTVIAALAIAGFSASAASACERMKTVQSDPMTVASISMETTASISTPADQPVVEDRTDAAVEDTTE